MADVFLLYISAAADLDLEREVLGRAVTEIPTTLAWRIVQTPVTADEPELDALAHSDLHVLLLGSDVRAPVGVEWMAARRISRLPTLLLKTSVTRTQAAQAFVRELQRYATWHSFETIEDLRRQVLILLADHILSHAEYFRIAEDEHEKISQWRNDLKKRKKQRVDRTRGGAGDSSVILSVERYVPSEGVLLKNPNEEE